MAQFDYSVGAQLTRIADVLYERLPKPTAEISGLKAELKYWKNWALANGWKEGDDAPRS